MAIKDFAAHRRAQRALAEEESAENELNCEVARERGPAKSLFECGHFSNEVTLRSGSSPVSLSNVSKAGSNPDYALVNTTEPHQPILIGVTVPDVANEDATQACNA